MPDGTRLAQMMVEMADNLVDQFDVVELLSVLTQHCVELLDVAAAGVMLSAPAGDLRVVASSSEAMRVVELFELQHDEGPCPDCCRSGEPVVDENLVTAGGRWPRFAPVAVKAGFMSVDAVPMRLRGSVIGALNLFRADAGGLREDDVVAAQALADVATITVLQQRMTSAAQVVNEQLNRALTSRIVIEQAKGVLSERAELTMESAFDSMRRYARSNNRQLVEVAHAIIDRSLSPATLTSSRASS